MTKIEVQIRETPKGRKVLLVDQNGDVLPGQVETTYICGLEAIDQITVTFLVQDGRVCGSGQ